VSRTRLRILHVEDSPDDAELLLEELRRSGFEVHAQRVDNAGALREALRQPGWDLVLSDFAMPSFDALAALAELQQSALDLPFIIVSGSMSEEAAVSAMRAGAHDFFSKDRLARLPAAIERELGDARTRAERKKMQEQMLLSDRLVSIGTLAAGVAHEINNPLAYVIGNIEFALECLTRSARPANDVEVGEAVLALRQAREGSERIRVTTRDLKVFCRGDESQLAPVDAGRVLESAISMAWNEIRHRARLVRELQAVPHVDANANRLAQVFLNLLVNAAHAVPEGSIDQHEIRVALWSEGGRVLFEVSDSGSGMTPEVQAHLFDPFFTTKPIGVGTGLGLSICHGIVSELKGEISVRSQLGKGSTFRVSLPVGTLSESRQVSYPVAAPASRARIMVIDDEPALCQLVRRLLGGEHEVVIQPKARQALQQLETDRAFDMILCDLMMPDMTGMDFHAELSKAHPELLQRLVFLTGGAFTSHAARFLDRVPNRRLEKPFDPAALRSAVAKLMAAAGKPA
jgi:signal transduction histidine kinase